jgi:hypothetical protein
VSFELFHVRGAEKIIQSKNMEKDVKSMLEYVDDFLTGALHRGELLRLALTEANWRNDLENLRIIDGRKYRFKGFNNGIAIEANLNVYEYILEGLFRLQVGFDKGLIESSILILTGHRSERSSYGSTFELAKAEVELLYPTISLPVTIVIYDLGNSLIPEEIKDGGQFNDDNGEGFSETD